MNTNVIRNKVLEEPGVGVTDTPNVETDAGDSDDWPDILGDSDDWPDILIDL